MPIVYSINEHNDYHSQLEKTYWTISVYITDIENSFDFVHASDNASELSRYGPIESLCAAKDMLKDFADQVAEVAQYGKSQYGPTLVFTRHPLLVAGQQKRRASDYKIAV